MGELNEQQYIDFEMEHIKKTSTLDEQLPFIKLIIREAFRNGYEHANITGLKNTYSRISDIFIRKMQLDLHNGRIDHDEFIRINRGIGAIADYLDHKELE